METIPRMYHGEDARKFFFACANAFSQDDATGKAYVVRRNALGQLEMLPLTGCAFEAMLNDLLVDVSLQSDYEMIVIDSGNSHGDSWIAAYYPLQCALSFVNQLFAGGRRNDAPSRDMKTAGQVAASQTLSNQRGQFATHGPDGAMSREALRRLGA